MLSFRRVLEAVEASECSGDDSVEIAGVAYDSRQVKPGDLFVAIRGLQQDGHGYVDDAIGRGAAAVLVEDDLAGLGAPSGRVSNGRRALALAAAALHDFPGRKLKLIGVTGTDGKTTTTHLTAAILEAAGHRVGVVSTVAVRLTGVSWPNATNHTTPQAPELQALLAKMVAAGAEYAVVEVSSHALALERVAGCDFDVAVFTNLTPEHLDFHGSLDEYRRQKGRLFAMLGEGVGKGVPKAGVANADDPSFTAMAAACPTPILAYGLDSPADLVARNLRLEADGSRFLVSGPFGEVELQTRLPGRFNVANWLAAIGAAASQGARLDDFARAAATTDSVTGRLQRVDLGQPFSVVVDFAHTPNALEAALKALRPLTSGRLILLFGHAGGRDTQNRVPMGEIAGRLADLTILTADDPYDEPPEVMIEVVAQGLEKLGRHEGKDYRKIPDRKQAIEAALTLARPGDTVLLAGRGHEQSTTIRGQKVHLDDVEVATRILGRRYGSRRAA